MGPPVSGRILSVGARAAGGNARLVPCAVYRGPGGRFSPQGPNPRQNAPGGLIIPGQRTPPPIAPGRLIIPGDEQEKQKEQQAGAPVDGDDSLSAPRKTFRPPAGFMDEGGIDDSTVDMSVDQMLAKLKGGSDFWHKLARYFPRLAAEGFDAVVLEEMTGLTKASQNVMSVAANVYASVVKAEPEEDVVEFFDKEGSQELLYELRFLSGAPRTSAALYIARNNSSRKEALELARAVKEHIRRQGQKEGFSSDPEDCLAYKYYRNAIEVRDRDTKIKNIKKGLDIALTPTAVKALEKLMEETIKTAKKKGLISSLQVVKLMKDEVGFRPVPVLGHFDQVTEEDLVHCPTVGQSGAFGIFTTSTEEITWVVLPRWEAVKRASRPFALSFKDCKNLPAAALPSLGASPEKRKKLRGSAMVLADKVFGEIESDSHYVVKTEAGSLDIVQGSSDLQNVLASVILIVRPPDEELVYDTLGGLEI